MITIRNPRAAELARELAAKRQITMTEAVIQALASELQREAERLPLADRLGKILDSAIKPDDIVGPGMTKAEIDAMWGQ